MTSIITALVIIGGIGSSKGPYHRLIHDLYAAFDGIGVKCPDLNSIYDPPIVKLIKEVQVEG